MKILISTPAYGGVVTTGYTSSLMMSTFLAMGEGLVESCPVHFQADSLIHRARDRAADYFLRGDYDRLITIDADISWDYASFKRLITSPHDIIAGAYPLKAFPVVMNFNALPDRGQELFKTARGIDFDAWKVFCAKHTDANGIAEVQHVATGFMSVTRRVFEALAKDSGNYGTLDSVTGERRAFHHFYESGVHEGQLESEDWSLCRRAREAGFKVHLDTKMTLTHHGNHSYKLGQFFGSAD